MMHLEANGERGAAAGTQGNGGLSLVPSPVADEATIAAIALALELEGQPEATRIALNRGTSFWALAGRARVLRGR